MFTYTINKNSYLLKLREEITLQAMIFKYLTTNLLWPENCVE